MERANPFAELDELEIKPKKRNPDVVEQISQIADDHGFPSRQAVKPVRRAEPQAEEKPQLLTGSTRRGRRFRSHFTAQANIRLRPEDADRLYRIADEYEVQLGEVVRMALDALEKQEG